MSGRHRKTLLALALALGLTVAAIGCGDDADDASGGDAAPGGATTSTTGAGDDAADECTAERRGGRLSMGMFVETVGLDPVVASGNGVAGATEMAAIYDTLMRYD